VKPPPTTAMSHSFGGLLRGCVKSIFQGGWPQLEYPLREVTGNYRPPRDSDSKSQL
jgi:hypothetical protein